MRSVVAGATVLLLLAGRAQAEPFTFETYARLQHLDELQISPDGSLLAVTVKQLQPDAGDAVRSLWILSSDGVRRDKVDDHLRPDGSQIAWAPSGTRVAYVGGTLAAPELVTFDVASRTRRVLLTGDITSFAWSPGGDSIAAIYGPSPTRVRPDVTSSAETPSTRALSIVNVSTANETRLADTLADEAGELAWAPDGSRLAYTAGSDLYLIGVATHATVALVKRTGREQHPVWSPNGRQIAFASQYGRSGEQLSISLTDSDPTHAPEDRFATFDPGFGSFVVRYIAWTSDAKSLFVSGLSHMRQKLYRLDLASGAAHPITTGDSVYHNFSVTSDGKTFACLASDPTMPSVILVSPTDAFVPRKIAWDYPELASIARAEVRVLTWQSDDLQLEGLVMLPPGYDRSKRYPTVVLTEGSHGTFDLSYSTRVSADTPGATFPFEPRVLAGKGYVVFMPNVRGSWGLGERVRKAIVKDIAEGPYRDLMAGIDALIAAGYVDEARMAILASGFDGYRAAYALTKTRRFKAAALAEPFGVNLISFHSQPIFGSWVESNLGGPPWEQAARYIELSPIMHAEKVTTPTLLFCMDGERQLAVEQCREFHHALRSVKTDTELLLYRADPWELGVRGTRSFIDIMGRIVGWIERWI